MAAPTCPLTKIEFKTVQFFPQNCDFSKINSLKIVGNCFLKYVQGLIGTLIVYNIWIQRYAYKKIYKYIVGTV